MTDVPNAQQIAMAAMQVQDYTPVAELAKAACMVQPGPGPYHQIMVAGCYMPAWQAKIAEAQFMLFLGMSHTN
jgi:hypothetical protein